MAWRDKHGDLEYGSKKDDAGTWWSSPAGKGRESTRRDGDTVSHYRHADRKVEGYHYNTKTGESKRFEKKDHR
jgi:hypothetical protein